MSVSANAIPGRFRVDEDECTSCGMCGVIAPQHCEPGVEGRGYVAYLQPRGEAEVSRCSDALESCPVDAIRDQGASSDGGTTTV